jgi:hypothetical protein
MSFGRFAAAVPSEPLSHSASPLPPSDPEPPSAPPRRARAALTLPPRRPHRPLPLLRSRRCLFLPRRLIRRRRQRRCIVPGPRQRCCRAALAGPALRCALIALAPSWWQRPRQPGPARRAKAAPTLPPRRPRRPRPSPCPRRCLLLPLRPIRWRHPCCRAVPGPVSGQINGCARANDIPFFS